MAMLLMPYNVVASHRGCTCWFMHYFYCVNGLAATIRSYLGLHIMRFLLSKHMIFSSYSNVMAFSTRFINECET